MTDVLASFILNKEPLSSNSRRQHKYVSLIETEFRKHAFKGAPFAGPLYLRVYYFHFRPDSRDADNFSKRVVDALKGTAYADDSLVIFRSAANIDLQIHRGVNLLNMREKVREQYIEASDKREPILYIEIGRFAESMLAIGGI